MAPGHALDRERLEAMVEWVVGRMEVEHIRLDAKGLRRPFLVGDEETTRQLVGARR